MCIMHHQSSNDQPTPWDTMVGSCKIFMYLPGDRASVFPRALDREFGTTKVTIEFLKVAQTLLQDVSR